MPAVSNKYLIREYQEAFTWLQRYDDELFKAMEDGAPGALPSVDQARLNLEELKAFLMAKGEASELFARDRGDELSALLGNLEQTVFGSPAYPTIESKAAHLLYFVVKNHPFSDGNKRSGAFLFVAFLNFNERLLGGDYQVSNRISPMALTALTLLVAQSNPEQKDTVIALIVAMLTNTGC
jgi:prophage maintenance system killer protein